MYEKIRQVFAKAKNLDNETELPTAFTDGKYKCQMKQDIQEAQQIGVSGVPFFVFDRKHAVSGAQPPQVFLETLEKSYEEWRKKNSEIKLQISEGQSCSVDGKCE